MFDVDLLQTATADLEDAYQWYEDHVQGLGDRFIREIDHYINLIAQNPHQFPVQFSEKYRFANLHKFPYRLVYYFVAETKVVYVTAVFHTSRDPINF